MKPLAPDFHEFIFLCQADDRFGVWLTRPYFELVRQFQRASEGARTWAEFTESFGPNQWNFIDQFIGNDQESEPEDDQLIADLRSELWIFYDADFPLLQCHEETWSACRGLFPHTEGLETERTEYGVEVAFFPVTSYESVKSQLTTLGHRVSRVENLAG